MLPSYSPLPLTFLVYILLSVREMFLTCDDTVHMGITLVFTRVCFRLMLSLPAV